MTSKELRMLGSALYLCEGTKLRKDPRYKNTYIYAIEFTNANPDIVALFLRFMRKELKIDPKKVRGQLFTYEDQDQKRLIKTWSNATNIPVTQFQKVIVLKSKNTKNKPNPLGTFKVRYSSKEIFLRLQLIIDEFWRDARAV